MKTTPRIALAIFFSLALMQCLAGENGPAISLSEYRDRLGQFAAQADLLKVNPEQASQLVTEIPDQLNVNTGTRDVTVNFRDLKNDITSFSSAEAAQKPERLLQIRDYLGELQLAATNLSTTEHKSEQQKLNEILARREFHKVRGPGAAETFLAKVYRWLARWLFKLRVGSGATNNVLQGLVYTLVGLAVLLIHLAYWAGISSLESGGAWKPNRARTPREYLRMVGTRSPHHRPLSALTRKFEVVWYGERVAAEADFQETLAQLEQLGCR